MGRWIGTLGWIAVFGAATTLAQVPPPASQPSPPPEPMPIDPPPSAPLIDPPLDAPPADRPLTPPPAGSEGTPVAPPLGTTPPPAGTPADAPPPPRQPQLSLAEVLERVKGLIDAQNYDDALSVLTSILRNDPENFDARLLLAKLHEARQDFMSARAVYVELAKFQPNNFDVNIGLGRIFVTLQYWRQVPRYLEAADRVARPDQKAEVKILLAIAYRGAGNLKEALTAAEAAVAADPESYEARETLMDVRLDQESYDQAAADARSLIELSTRQVETHRGDAEALRKLTRAQESLISVLRQHYTTLYIRDAGGQFTDKLTPGREKDAAAFLQQIVDALLRLAELRRVLAYHDALVLAERSSQLDPTNTEVLKHEALLLLNTDQTTLAVQKLQRILELDPSHAEAIRELNRLNAPLTSQPSATQPVDAGIPQ